MEGTTLEPGTVVEHRYVIRRFIASGGVSHLYAASHRVTGRDVALKIPRVERELDPAVHERLAREAQALARVRHPGVVEIVDAGQRGNVPYIVLELIEGRTLGGLLAARARLDWGEVAVLGARIAQIIGFCHDRGVIHRDLKPDNVFATPNSDYGVKLFDFGIARLLDVPGVQPQQKLTQVGSIVGTPEYMAPEALELNPEQDHRIDVYSLGVMLFELLTGAVPFEGRYAEVLVQVSTKPLPKLAELRPELPADLIHVVEKCLSKAPGDRYQTMAEVSSALTALTTNIAALKIALPREVKTTLADSPVALSARPTERAGEPTSVPRDPSTLVSGKSAAKPATFVTPATGKRRFPRAPYTTPAQLVLSGDTVSGQVEEISEGGVQFIAARGIPSGDRGEFRFAEPITGRIIKVTAISRWTKAGRAGRHATGFEFENAPEEARESIRKYVSLMGGS
jgi:serine/threonine-protein kinase